MATATKKLGPADHGRVLSLDDYEAGDYELGHKYELINARLYVSPLPNLSEDRAERWLAKKVESYADRHPEVINYISRKPRVFVPGAQKTTCPEPDLVAYRNFPLETSLKELRWHQVSPFLVVEIPSADDPDKDFVRNVELYLRVPTIKEYWILDTLADPDQPRLLVHRRHGSRWRVIEVAFGETYTTPLLPGFKLLLDPHK